MAQPLHRQYDAVEYPLEVPVWQSHQQHQQYSQYPHYPQYRQHQHSHCPIASTNASSTPPSQGQFWESPSTLNNSFVWKTEPPTDPFIVSKSDNSMLANNNLAYNCAAMQGAWNNSEGAFGSGSAWPSSRISGLPDGDNTNTTNMSMIATPPQGSVFNETMDYKAYALSPGLSTDHASPATEWSTVGSVFSLATEGTSPGSMTSIPMLVPTRTISSSGLSTRSPEGPPQSGLARTSALTHSPDACRQQSSVTYAFNGVPSHSSAYSYSQTSSPGATQWYPPGYSPHLSGLPRSPQGSNTASYKQTNMFEASEGGQGAQPKIQWTGCVPGVSSLDQAQDNSQTTQNADPDAKRKSDDEMLIKCKAQGITYKEIKKRLRTKVAESTLRGRYRALTKPRKDRVRKPVWTDKDLTLLEEFVERELSRIGRRDPSLSRSARLGKIQWTKVVEHIQKHGSYRFGVATAKKKWVEISNDH